MPFDSLKDLPKAVQAALPTKAQKQWLAVFNSSYNKEPDAEEGAHYAKAWGVINNHYKKDEASGKWVPLKEGSMKDETYDPDHLDEANPYHDPDTGKFGGPELKKGTWSLIYKKGERYKYKGSKLDRKTGKRKPSLTGAPKDCGRDARDKGGDVRCWDGAIKSPIAKKD